MQSIANMVEQLDKKTYQFYIFCSNRELDGSVMHNLELDVWTNFNTNTNVWYASKSNFTILKSELGKIKPDTVFINGIFSWNYNFTPLFFSKTKETIISPRGMLQAGALSGKSLKKRIYLSFLKFSGLVKNVTWHATNEEEQKDIKRIFGKNAKCILAPNIPKEPVAFIRPSDKVSKKLKLIYLSLITEKKNLYVLLEIILKAGHNISLDIYGPVKDKAYWEKCNELIKNNPGTISYSGDIRPEHVQELFSQYDASILLTKGENFGHALYESLSAGRPIITSLFTPWNNLAEKKAGWNVDINDPESVVKTIRQIAHLDQAEHQFYCEGAYQIASDYYSNGDFINSYKKLFG